MSRTDLDVIAVENKTENLQGKHKVKLAPAKRLRDTLFFLDKIPDGLMRAR